MSTSDRPITGRLESLVRAVGASVAPVTTTGPARSAVQSVRAVSFWAAVCLPVAYLPAIAAGVVESHPAAFALLLVANALALYGGRNHRRRPPERQ